MLQFLKRLKVYTKLVPEAVCKLKYSHQNFICGHLHNTIIYKSIFYNWNITFKCWFICGFNIFSLFQFHEYLSGTLLLWCIVIELEHAAHMYYRKIVKQRIPQNKLFGLRDHIIDFIDSVFDFKSVLSRY